MRGFRRSFLPVLVILHASRAFAGSPTLLTASRHDTSAPFGQLSATARAPKSAPDTEGLEPRSTGPAVNSGRADPVASELAGPLAGVTSLIRFDGQSAADNRRVLGFAFVPPDTDGAVGASQFVQMVNVTIAVYSKRDGTLQLGPAPIHTLWKGFGGLCENGGGSTNLLSDGGDPIVLYDHLADRWLVSQLQFDGTFTHTAQCIAVSTTSDATGAYHRYEFDFGANFPDYPKFGIWPDGYYNTINVFPGKSFAGAQACAFDRTAMLAGAPTSAICFQQPPSVSSLLPADLDGSTLPPAGAPNYLVGLADASHLNLFKFHADFANPSSSTFSGPTLVPVADFNQICDRTSLACIAEPEPGEKVDGLSDRVMFRLAYRNFGDHESLVVNHTVLGGLFGGVRWYEIRNPRSAPAVFQQGTVVDPSSDFWMGSIAMDQAGDIALGFSAMSHTQFSSVYVAGRTPGDPPGKMFGPMVLATGGGVQISSFRRWGDYSSMTVDPKDDCTFWYTQEYYTATGSTNWATRVGAFKFDRCKPGEK